MQLNRRAFIASAALAPLPLLAKGTNGPVLSSLYAFIPGYLSAHNSPGLILGIANAKGWSETASFGFADLQARRPIRDGERFQIGSITKSFTSLIIMQLVEEGKVTLDADVTDYLPGLALNARFGSVKIHHLLCHSSGIPSETPAPGWPDQVVEQTFAPGSRFHYSDMGYEWLGRVIVTRGGEPLTTAIQRRILHPLGMTETSASIVASTRPFEVPSYTRRDDDRPYPRMGALTRAGSLTFVLANGCIASSARDMAKYIMMLARRGNGPSGRLLSPKSFELMTTPWIKTESTRGSSSVGGYGYGWIIDSLDGKPVIRHTGGMASFVSSIHVDLTLGVGAFASINAQQHYAPVAVTAYAVKSYRSYAAGSAVPKAPPVDPGAAILIKDYVGQYFHSDGRKMAVSAHSGKLWFMTEGKLFALESLGNDKFLCLEPAFRLFTFLFTRQHLTNAVGASINDAVVALSWARDSYVRPGARLPTIAPPETMGSADLRSYEGLYSLGNGWVTSARIIVRDGRLWMDSFDGIVPLASVGSDRFRLADEAFSPDTIAFSPASVEPRVLALNATVLTRIGDAFFE